MNHRFSALLPVLFGISFLLLPSDAYSEDAKQHSAVTPLNRTEAWWTERHEQMNDRVQKGNVELLMIGDSITHAWETAGSQVWAKYYGNRNAVNLGIGGDQTGHILWRLDHGNIDGIHPKLAVLMIGTNNSGGNTSQEIADGIEAIVAKLRTKLPQTKVLVLAIFPRGQDKEDRQRKVNQGANALVQKLADGKMVHYLDIGENFLEPEGTLSREIMPDLLHLSPKGYTIWAESIEPTITRLTEAGAD